jgi:hypothetical protein
VNRRRKVEPFKAIPSTDSAPDSGTDTWTLTGNDSARAKGEELKPEDLRHCEALERTGDPQLREIRSHHTELLLDEAARRRGLRKGTRAADERALHEALEKVAQGMSVNEAAETTPGAKRSTLQRRVNKKT